MGVEYKGYYVPVDATLIADEKTEWHDTLKAARDFIKNHLFEKIASESDFIDLIAEPSHEVWKDFVSDSWEDKDFDAIARAKESAGVDIGFDADELSLADYGIAGRIVYTPGHTAGSISVLLDSGEAIVGDMAMNSLPMRLSPGLAVFADNLPQLIASWRMLLSRDVQTIYPSHGGPFSPEVMRRAVSGD